MTDAISVIREHIPSLSDANEDEIIERALDITGDISSITGYGEEGYTDAADLALRTCACGERIDGFYEYVDHLITVFGGEAILGTSCGASFMAGAICELRAGHSGGHRNSE